MPVEVEFAETRAAAGKIPLYYGYDPDTEYVLRSRSRRYNQTTMAYYRFANGETIAARMKPDATEEQRWNRGERLKWFEQNPGYRIYQRGQQPEADLEPMWRGQEPPEEALLPDSGESDAKWESAPAPGQLHAEVETAAPVEPHADSGEAAPAVPLVVRTFAGARAAPADAPKEPTIGDGDADAADEVE